MIDRRLAAVVIAGAWVIAPAAATAQSRAFLSPSFTAAHTYESNLFAAPASLGPRADFISQLGPSLIAGYQSLPFELAVNYQILAERYQRHVELNDPAARQEAGVALRYRPRERFSLSADAGYISTRTPSEFNLRSGLDAGRAPAERVALASAMTFNFTPATTFNAAYTLERDVLVGVMTSATHRPRAGIATRTGVRNAYRLDYELRRFAFSGGAPMVSHALVGSWQHELTQRVGCEIAVGPRISDGAIRPDVATRLRWRLADADISLAYVRTDMTAIGERGTFDVHALSSTVSYRPARRVSLDVTPLLSRNARGRQHIAVSSLGAGSTFAVNRHLSVAAIARFSRQRGMLAGPRHVMASRSLGLHLTISPVRNDRDVTDRRP